VVQVVLGPCEEWQGNAFGIVLGEQRRPRVDIVHPPDGARLFLLGIESVKPVGGGIYPVGIYEEKRSERLFQLVEPAFGRIEKELASTDAAFGA
jgi:hypothetical protein